MTGGPRDLRPCNDKNVTFVGVTRAQVKACDCRCCDDDSGPPLHPVPCRLWHHSWPLKPCLRDAIGGKKAFAGIERASLPAQ